MKQSEALEPDSDAAEVIAFHDAAEFESWLADNVDRSAGVWLKIAKKGSGIASLTDDEAVDIGLCYGWISGQRKSFDEVYYLLSGHTQTYCDGEMDEAAAGGFRQRTRDIIIVTVVGGLVVVSIQG